MFVLVAGNENTFIASFADKDVAQTAATFLGYDTYQILDGETYHQPRPKIKTLFEALSPTRIYALADNAEDALNNSNSRSVDVVIVENVIRKALMEASANVNE